MRSGTNSRTCDGGGETDSVGRQQMIGFFVNKYLNG